jgi:metallo-beta-lactamase family protein
LPFFGRSVSVAVMTSLQFLGATGTVTGSKYLLEDANRRLMVDCGLFQGLKELRLRNWDRLPINPASVDWLALTHAHIDHSGYVPRLVQAGFKGPIYATEGTADLVRILLPDSARLQEEDAQYANQKGFSRHHPALPLYTEQDASVALKHLQPVRYNEVVKLTDSLSMEFISAGHILGSSFISIRIGDPPVNIVFSGDVGRYDQPILNDPSPINEADYLLVESTYGDRPHEHKDPKSRLAEIINEAVAREGKVIIPAFAVGRTQLVIYYLRELEEEGRIPILPVTLDSPMAVLATRLYARHKEDHDLDMQRLDAAHENALATRNFHLVESRGQSKALNNQKGPSIIISASGMATGGRVVHHLAQNLPDPSATVIFVGYQADGTRGRRLVSGEKSVKIHGEMIPVRSRIETIGSLSAHADSSEIVRWLSGFKRAPRETFIVHGEPEAARALARTISTTFGWNVTIPSYKQIVNLS